MEQQSVTLSIPTDLLNQASELREVSESLNEMIVEAIAHEVQRRRVMLAHQRIVARSYEIEAKTGIQPGSVELIRQLRTNEGQRD